MISDVDNLILCIYPLLKIDNIYKYKLFMFFNKKEYQLATSALLFWNNLNKLPDNPDKLPLVYFKLNYYWFHSSNDNKERATAIKNFLLENFKINSSTNEDSDLYLLIKDSINKLRETLDDLNGLYGSILPSKDDLNALYTSGLPTSRNMYEK